MPNNSGVNINIKTVAAMLTVAIMLSGIIGNYFVTGYRIGQLEEDMSDLEDYISIVDDENNSVEKAMVEMKADIKYIRATVEKLTR